MKTDLIKVIAYDSHGAEHGLDDAECVAGFRHDRTSADDPSHPVTAEARDAADERHTFPLRDYLRDDAPARRDDGVSKQALAEDTKTDRAACPAIKAPLIFTGLSAADGGAELTGWSPRAPDAYWRSEA